LFEEKYVKKPYHYFTPNHSKPQPLTTTTTQTTGLNTLPPLLPTPSIKPFSQPFKANNVKRITNAEMQIRREKGLCFTCDEKFTPTHKCPNKYMFLLQTNDQEGADPDPDPPDSATVNESELNSYHHLSYNALKGANGLGTIKFQRQIQGVNLQILLDSGNSDNFIQPRIAHFLQLPIEPTPQFQVMVGNGNVLKAEGCVRQLQVKAQNQVLELSAMLLPIAGANLVLGASWLATLGPHVANYNSLTLKFMMKGKFVTLQGEQHTEAQQAEFHQFKRLVHTHSIAEVFMMHWHMSDSIDEEFQQLLTDISTKLALLLRSYSTVFTKPRGLPPNRQQNHAIPLISGSDPIKVKPYRYPHSQKTQIEKMVQYMLHEGLIQPSTSPFSSPIILVKKKRMGLGDFVLITGL